MDDINLIILNLNYNNIEFIPNKIQYLTNLQELYLTNNNIKIIPSEIQYLINFRRPSQLIFLKTY